MRYFLFLLFTFLLFSGASHAAGNKKKYRGEPRTEVELINSVVACLHNKDTASYFNLFPPFDTLWRMVMHNADNTPETAKQLNDLREHPQSLIEFDPLYNRDIIGRFCAVLTKGEDSGLIWNNIVIQRYELQKQELTDNLRGYDRIAPERFKGYLFVRDMLNHVTFCITITEIQKIKGYFVGGQVINILEASTIDEFISKEVQERKYFAWLAEHPIVDSANVDSLKNKMVTAKKDTSKSAKNFLSVAPEEDESIKIRKEVVDRKYYEGKFDEEIPVQLYVRYMKNVGNGKIVSFDGLYKFGDQKSYIRLDITKTPEGKWLMEDEAPIGTLELELKDRIYTGGWTNNENQTGYDVEMKQTGIPEKKLELFDDILDKGVSGRVDEDNVELDSDGNKKPVVNEDKIRLLKHKKKKQEDADDADKDNKSDDN